MSPGNPRVNTSLGIAGFMLFQPRRSPVHQLRLVASCARDPETQVSAQLPRGNGHLWVHRCGAEEAPRLDASLTALWHIHLGGDQETNMAQLAWREGLAMEGCFRLTVSLGPPACLVQGKSVSRLLERRH